MRPHGALQTGTARPTYIRPGAPATGTSRSSSAPAAMAPLATVTCLALLGLAAAAGPYGSSNPSSNYDAPKYGGYSAPVYTSRTSQPSSGYGAPKPNSGYGAPKPNSGYGAPRVQPGASFPTSSVRLSSQPATFSSSSSRGPSSFRQVSKPGTFPSSSSRGPSSFRQSSKPAPFTPGPPQRGPAQRGQNGKREPYYSWIDSPEKVTWEVAKSRCKARGSQLISLKTSQLEVMINEAARLEKRVEVPYYWTSGNRRNRNGWQWADGTEICTSTCGSYTNWSETGGNGEPQPDNREQFGKGEQCLAVLFNFYGDGDKWHDIGCHHTKFFVCES